MRAPDWLTARPVAHRGLHDRARGVLENMPAAISAAIAGNFAIEVDIQLTADAEAMVHHDDTLGRLNDGNAALLALTAAELKQVRFHDTAERMMALPELLELVGGRVPLVIELKSHFDGDRKLATRLTQALAAYRGPVAAMSFDPDQVLALRQLAPNLVRGITAERRYDDAYWDKLNQDQRNPMVALRHGLRTRPHFIAYRVDDLPAPAPWIAQKVFGCALLAWTVRTPQQRSRAAHHADQMIFEGFVPNT